MGPTTWDSSHLASLGENGPLISPVSFAGLGVWSISKNPGFVRIRKYVTSNLMVSTRWIWNDLLSLRKTYDRIWTRIRSPRRRGNLGVICYLVGNVTIAKQVLVIRKARSIKSWIQSCKQGLFSSLQQYRLTWLMLVMHIQLHKDLWKHFLEQGSLRPDIDPVHYWPTMSALQWVYSFWPENWLSAVSC